MTSDIQVYKGAELTGEMIAADPERYQVLANGAVYDHAVKYIVKAPPDELQPFAQEQASANAAKKRWDQYRERAELGAVAGASAPGAFIRSSLGAWEWIVSRQTQLAGMTNKGRDSTNAAKFVGSALDALPDRRNSPEPPASGATLAMSSDVAQRLIDMLAGAVAGSNGDGQ